MAAARPTAREEERLARLAEYRIVGTPPEPVFDDLARRAQEALHAPLAWLAFHDGARDWVKAASGIAVPQILQPRRSGWSRRTACICKPMSLPSSATH